MKRLLRWIAPLLFLVAAYFPVLGQTSDSTTDPSAPEKGTHVPALEYTLAFLFVIAVLVILCKPSRKA